MSEQSVFSYLHLARCMSHMRILLSLQNVGRDRTAIPASILGTVPDVFGSSQPHVPGYNTRACSGNATNGPWMTRHQGSDCVIRMAGRWRVPSLARCTDAGTRLTLRVLRFTSNRSRTTRLMQKAVRTSRRHRDLDAEEIGTEHRQRCRSARLGMSWKRYGSVGRSEDGSVHWYCSRR